MNPARDQARYRRVLPCGGAVEVARSYLKIHVPNRRTGHCRGCRDHYPCPERRDAETLLGTPGPRRGTALLAVPLLFSLGLIAAATAGLLG